MGEASPDARDDIEPAEQSLGQRDLMEGVPAEGFEVVGSRRWNAPAKIADRTVAFVEERGRADLLAKAGELEIGEAFDGLVEFVDLRLAEEVEGKVVPKFVDLDKGAGLNVLAIFAFEKVAHDLSIALIAHSDLCSEIAGQCSAMNQPDALTLFVDGLVVEIEPGLLIVSVVIFDGSFAETSWELIIYIRSDAEAALLTHIKMQGAVELIVPVPIVAGEEERPVKAAVPRNQNEIVWMPAEAALVIGIVKHRYVADVEDGIARLDVFAGDDCELLRAQMESGVEIIVGGELAIHADVNAGFFLADDRIATDKKWALSGFEIVRSEMAGFEVVFGAVAGPGLSPVLDAHLPFGNDITGSLINLRSLGSQSCAAVLDDDAIRGSNESALAIKFHLAGAGKLPLLLQLLRGESAPGRHREKKSRAKFSHRAGTAKRKAGKVKR